MRIKRVQLKDFRAFHGTHEINFAYEDDSVNLIVAENEVGKTTLLNAIIWCLYDRFTQNTENPNTYINKYSKRSNVTQCKVEVDLVDESQYEEYSPNILRITRFHHEGKSNNVLAVAMIDGVTGESRKLDNPKDLINEFCPDAISQYFFFDGEGVQLLTSNNTLLKHAIRSIQGLDAAEGALKDLEKYSLKQLAAFNAVNKGNEQITRLIKKINQSNDKIDEFTETEVKIAEKLRKLKQEKLKLNTSIGELGTHEVTRLQTNIRNLEKSITSNSNRLVLWEKKQIEFVGQTALAISSFHHLDKVNAYISEAASVGGLPSGYEEVFVNNTLKALTCICGEKFKKDDKRFNQIKSMLENARTESLDNKIYSIKAAQQMYTKVVENFNKDLTEIDTNIDHFSTEIKNDKNKLKLDKEQLSNTDEKSIKVAADKIAAIDMLVIQENRRSERCGMGLKSALADKNISERELTKLSAGSQFLDNENAERDFIADTIHKLKDLIAQQEINGKERITDLMNEYLSRYARGNNSFVFDGDTYRPVILDSGIETIDPGNIDEERVAILSTGGAAVKRNLFFATALTSLSRERENDDTKYHIPGSIAPIVVDAPFSNLDSTNTVNLSELLINTADQLIIMISSSAYNNGFKETIDKKEHKGKLKSLHYLTRSYHGPNEGKTKEEKRKNETPISINGDLIKTSIYDCPIETSNINQVDL